jgi:hypothetical protein
MRLSAEAALMLLAAALYLVDALQLLRSDEAMLVRGGRGRWRAGFGANGWRLRGQEPWLPNPFAPHRLQRRLRWSFEDPVGAGMARHPLRLPPQIGRFGFFAWTSATCIFVLLPAALFVPLGVGVTLGVIALLYLNILAALGLVVAWRRPLCLSAPQVAGLAFECLVCAPMSINLVRKLCARVPVDERFNSAAQRLLDAEGLAAAKAQCLLRLDEQLAWEPEGNARATALQAGRRHLAADA